MYIVLSCRISFFSFLFIILYVVRAENFQLKTKLINKIVPVDANILCLQNFDEAHFKHMNSNLKGPFLFNFYLFFVQTELVIVCFASRQVTRCMKSPPVV